MFSLKEVKNKVYELGEIIGLKSDSHLFPMFLEDNRGCGDGASIHIEESKYCYLVMERGQIVKKHESENLDEILYHLFSDITFSLAVDYEVRHRNKEEDFRRIMFAKQLELLQKINENYCKKREEQIADILQKHPYRS